MNEMRYKLRDALDQAVRGDGSFSVHISATKDFLSHEERESAFFLATALRSLAGVSVAQGVTDLLMKRLKGEMSANGSWNYWLRASTGAKDMPYPDDLDTTCVALHGVSLHDPSFLSGERLAAFVKLLIAVEVEAGGPYATWLVGSGAAHAWHDVDPVVNANIAALLSSQDIRLPGLDAYLKEILEKKSVLSPYYPNRSAFISALSFRAPGAWVPIILEEALALFRRAADPLERSLLLDALVRLKADAPFVAAATEELRGDVERGDAAKPQPLCIDRMRGGTTYVGGASAVTLAAVLGALTRAEVYLAQSNTIKTDERMMSLKLAVKERAEERFSLLDSSLAARAHLNIEDLFASDSRGEKTLFPYFVASSLKRAEEIPDDFFIDACLAHTLGWLAYTLYDNVIDGESDPRDLPVANVALRELTVLFSKILEPEVLSEAMDRVESANAWEVSTCRLEKRDGRFVFPSALPAFGRGEKLVDRSWGIVLAARAIFLKLGYAPNGQEIKAFEEYCRHFILAKQLNDDAHDWEQDLKRGQLTKVNVDVLERLKSRGFDISRPDWMEKHEADLQRLYWYESLERACADIFFHVELAGEAGESLPEVSRPFWRSLVAGFAASARKALHERNRTVEFLKKMKT